MHLLPTGTAANIAARSTWGLPQLPPPPPPLPRPAAQDPFRPHTSNNTIRCLTVFPGKPARFFERPEKNIQRSNTPADQFSMARSGPFSPRSIAKKLGGPMWRAGQGLSGLNSGTETPASDKITKRRLF
jgi:hypothetical protein